MTDHRRSVILADGRRGRIYDIDTGEAADVTVTIEQPQLPKYRDSTSAALTGIGIVAAALLLIWFGWFGLLAAIVFWPILRRL